LLVALAGAVGCTAHAQASQAGRTYVPNCGNTSYLDYKPHGWSSGCTAGSLNMVRARWSWWGRKSARGTGTAVLRGPCERTCADATTYRAATKLGLSGPRFCHDDWGKSHRYFSRARFSVLYGTPNPWGFRAGWRAERVTLPADQGLCTFSPH
jgi:hypothetical protein